MCRREFSSNAFVTLVFACSFAPPRNKRVKSGVGPITSQRLARSRADGTRRTTSANVSSLASERARNVSTFPRPLETVSLGCALGAPWSQAASRVNGHSRGSKCSREWTTPRAQLEWPTLRCLRGWPCSRVSKLNGSHLFFAQHAASEFVVRVTRLCWVKLAPSQSAPSSRLPAVKAPAPAEDLRAGERQNLVGVFLGFSLRDFICHFIRCAALH